MSGDGGGGRTGWDQQPAGGTGKSPSVAIVGGGFGGVGAAVLLVRAGYPDVTIFERGDRIGGVWAHNTYPGAACDVPSHLYEFSFEPNPRWSRRYAQQAEIQEYIEAVARRHGVLENARTGTEVTRATWDEPHAKWQLETTAGSFEADILITACGQLSIPKSPAIKGLDSFTGPVFHTAGWRHDVDLTGKRVAVIGTGCSAIQTVPAIQPAVERIDVYQRSPGWTMPKMDFEYSVRARRLFERFPVLQRLDRMATFAFMDIGAAGMTSQRWLLAPFRAAGRQQIKKAIKDGDLAARVTPADEVGCKRIMLTDEWYPTLEKPNVELITERIEQITPTGITTADGNERPVDAIVLATGFESHAFVAPMEIVGADGRSLAEEWDPVARAYLGLSVPGFPNMFLLYGPNTNGGTGSVIYVIEAGMAHVIAALDALQQTNADRIEVRRERVEAFDRELRSALAGTVWHTGCTSWYVDQNGNDPSQWPWMWSTYRRRTQRLEPRRLRRRASGPCQPEHVMKPTAPGRPCQVRLRHRPGAAVVLLSCLGLLGVGCGADRTSGLATGATRRSLASQYLAIANAGNRRLDSDFDPLEGRDRNNLARARADLRDAAATELLFDRRLLRIAFPSETERVVRNLYRANQARSRHTSAAAASRSLRELHGYEPRLDGANRTVEQAVGTIRRQLGLPPPSAS